MERWVGRVAVVTGASAGIGAAIAYQLQDAGLTVVALARRVEKIEGAVEQARKDAVARGRTSLGKAAVAGELHSLKCDVANEEDIVKAFKWVKDNVGGVDVLVNNAGLVRQAALTNGSTGDWKSLLDVNVLGLSICTREAVKLMREKGVDDGHIVHIGSVTGHIPPMDPPTSMYFASKHAVRVLTEGLRKELVAAKSKIRITEVSPGVVLTDILGEGNQAFKSMPHLFAEDIAESVLYALGTPPHVQIHEIIVRPVGEQF